MGGGVVGVAQPAEPGERLLRFAAVAQHEHAAGAGAVPGRALSGGGGEPGQRGDAERGRRRGVDGGAGRGVALQADKASKVDAETTRKALEIVQVLLLKMQALEAEADFTTTLYSLLKLTNRIAFNSLFGDAIMRSTGSPSPRPRRPRPRWASALTCRSTLSGRRLGRRRRRVCALRHCQH